MRISVAAGLVITAALASAPLAGHEIVAKDGDAEPAFDIVRAQVSVEERRLVFRIEVSGRAGSSRPAPAGELAGAPVVSYVWPTGLDTAAAGFAPDQGILAFAVTAHPDFDDTPLFDEDRDGDPDNDGRLWHSHWVVLVRDEAGCEGRLKVKDIPEGASPKLPATWPGLPILIDSPGYTPFFAASTLTVRVPLRDAPELEGVAFDGVTAGLRVNESVHAPLLCVENVFDAASGDLSLPGRME